MLFPISVTDECDWRRTFSPVRSGETTSQNRLNLKNSEKIWRDARHYRARWLSRPGHRRHVFVVLRNRLESVILIAKVIEVRIGKPGPRALRVDLEHSHDPVRIGVWQRP